MYGRFANAHINKTFRTPSLQKKLPNIRQLLIFEIVLHY